MARKNIKTSMRARMDSMEEVVGAIQGEIGGLRD